MAATVKKRDTTIDGFQRYDAFPQYDWTARGLPEPKFGRPQEVRGGSASPVRTVAWSCDGKRAAVGYDNKGLRVWEADLRSAGVVVEGDRSSTPLPSGKATSPHLGHVAAVAWSPTDPHILVSGCKSGQQGVIAVWDVRTPSAPLCVLPPVRLDVMRLAFHPSGTQFAAVMVGRACDEAIFVKRVEGPDGVSWVQRQDARINGTGLTGGIEEINALTFGNGGKSVFGVSNDGSVNAWWYSVEERVLGSDADERPAKKARVGSPAPRAASPEPEAAKAEAVEEEVEREPEAVEAPEGAAEGGEGEGEEGAEGGEGGKDAAEAGEGEGEDVEKKDDGDAPQAEAEASGDADAEMGDADATAATAPGTPAPATAPASASPSRPPSPVKAGTPAADAEPDEAAIKKAKAEAARAAEVELVRASQLPRAFRKVLFHGLMLAFAMDPRGRYFAIGGHDARVSLFDTRDWIVQRTFDKPTALIRHLAFSHDGELLAVGGDDPFVLILGVTNGETVATVPIPSGTAINALAWHPSRNALAYSTNSKKSVVWYVVNQE